METTVSVVTGGAGGIGQCIAARLLAAGMTVFSLDVDADKLAQCAQEFNSDRFFPLVCDVTDEISVGQSVQTILARFGKIDVLVNNAGGSCGISQSVEDIDVEDWDRVVDLNLKSTFLCIAAVVPGMKCLGHGRIVNISSMAGRGRSVLGGAPYAAAKAGIIGLTRHISMDLGKSGITINVVAPGLVLSCTRVEDYWTNNKTELERQAFLSGNPLGRCGRPEDIAAAVLFLSGPDAAYMSGAVLDVNGGSWVG